MKPILFNTEMVRAILDGRKTVTRRVVKPQPISKICYICMGTGCGKWTYPSGSDMKIWGGEWGKEQPLPNAERARIWTPPCHTGDILYVRETWDVLPVTSGGHISGNPVVYYRADGDLRPEKWGGKWHPSIHMPKEAARLFLRVTGVRVERLQDIDYDGCKEEGIWDDYKTLSEKYHENLARCAYPVTYANLWDSTIRKADLTSYGWSANPWVWVIEFERISKEEAVKGGEFDA